MSKSIQDITEAMRHNPANIRYADAVKVAEHHFGKGRMRGDHLIFSMPWPGDPRVNLQNVKGKAKAYQVRQLISAIARMEEKG